MQYFSIIFFILTAGLLNSSVAITLMVWMEKGMILSWYRYWLACTLLPESTEKSRILSDILIDSQPDLFIQIYKETEQIGYLTLSNWIELEQIWLGKDAQLFEKFKITPENLKKIISNKVVSYEIFKEIWGVCPIEDLEGRDNLIEKHKERMLDLAKKETFWYKPLGGCSDCYHVYLTLITYSTCLGCYTAFLPFTLWLLPAYLGIVFLSGLLVHLFNK